MEAYTIEYKSDAPCYKTDGFVQNAKTTFLLVDNKVVYPTCEKSFNCNNGKIDIKTHLGFKCDFV
jgi:hypothetical protein